MVSPIGRSGGGIAHLLQVVEVAVGVPGLPLGGVAEERRDLGQPFDVRHLGEVQVPAVGLRFTRERRLQVRVRLRSLQRWHL